MSNAPETSAFEADRQRFLASFRQFMIDASVPGGHRQWEFYATISAMSQIAALTEKLD